MPEVPGDLTKQWVGAVIYGVLGLELAAVTGFAAAYNAPDFAPRGVRPGSATSPR